MDRRTLLAGAAATGLAAVGLNAAVGSESMPPRPPASGRAAPSCPPAPCPTPQLPAGTDTLPQIEHIVVIMMENHSFDDHLGTLGRGDGLTMGRDGRPVNYNPDPAGGFVRSFHNPNTCGEADSGIGQDWNKSHISWANGTNQGFVAACGGASMGLLERRRPALLPLDGPEVPHRRPLLLLGDGPDLPQPPVPHRRHRPRQHPDRRLGHLGGGRPQRHHLRPAQPVRHLVEGLLPRAPHLRPVRAGLPEQSRQGGPRPPVLRRRRLGESARFQPHRPLHQLLGRGRGHHRGRGLRRPVRRRRHAGAGLGQDRAHLGVRRARRLVRPRASSAGRQAGQRAPRPGRRRPSRRLQLHRVPRAVLCGVAVGQEETTSPTRPSTTRRSSSSSRPSGISPPSPIGTPTPTTCSTSSTSSAKRPPFAEPPTLRAPKNPFSSPAALPPNSISQQDLALFHPICTDLPAGSLPPGRATIPAPPTDADALLAAQQRAVRRQIRAQDAALAASPPSLATTTPGRSGRKARRSRARR